VDALTPWDREIGEERVDLALPHRLEMPFPVKDHETLDPRDIRLFRPKAVMTRTHGQANPIEQSRLAAAGVDDGRPGVGRIGLGRLGSFPDAVSSEK
jgi:hypothetical protein